MTDTLQAAYAFVQGLGVAALVVLLHSEVQRCVGGPLVKDLLAGLVFGCGALASMFAPVVLAAGLTIDARNVLIALSGLFAGPVSTIVAVVIAISFRLYGGGVGMVAGSAAIGIVGAVSIAVGHWMRRSRATLAVRHLVWVATLMPVSLLSTLLLPSSALNLFLSEGLWLYLAGNTSGVLVVGSLLMREARRIALERVLGIAALTDPLTGMANRRGFDLALARAFQGSRRGLEDLSVIVCDLDGLKLINDRFGHDLGDAAIAGTAEVIRLLMPSRSTSGRLGGDEFAVILPGTSADEAEHLAGQIRTALVLCDDLPVRLSLSIGTATLSGRDLEPAALLARADAAMYGRKRARTQAPSYRMAA